MGTAGWMLLTWGVQRESIFSVTFFDFSLTEQCLFSRICTCHESTTRCAYTVNACLPGIVMVFWNLTLISHCSFFFPFDILEIIFLAWLL